MTIQMIGKKEVVATELHPERLVDEVVFRFKRCLQKVSLFYVLSLFTVCLELFLFLLFLSPLMHSFFLGITLAIFFFTVLFFSIFRLYFEEEKTLFIDQISRWYVEQCKKIWGYEEGVTVSHLKIANALFQPVSRFQEQEKELYTLPFQLTKYIPQLSIFLEMFYRHDLLIIKERFLKASIEEHIKLIRCEPTNLEVHAALANAYVMLSSLYQDTQEGSNASAATPNWKELSFWLKSTAKTKIQLKSKFRLACQKAMEEFSILKEYAPQDPWVHTQLAYSFRDLNMPEKEIQEFEILVELMPQDSEILYKLGVLYFEQGHNAKGLQIYEKLKPLHLKKAEDLIQYYGKAHADHFRQL